MGGPTPLHGLPGAGARQEGHQYAQPDLGAFLNAPSRGLHRDVTPGLHQRPSGLSLRRPSGPAPREGLGRRKPRRWLCLGHHRHAV